MTPARQLVFPDINDPCVVVAACGKENPKKGVNYDALLSL